MQDENTMSAAQISASTATEANTNTNIAAPSPRTVPDIMDHHQTHRQPLNIALLTFGTRGDVQPSIRIAQLLISHGHRVRLAVAPSLLPLVRDEYGLEAVSMVHNMAPFLEFGLLSKGQVVLSMVNGEFKKLKAKMTEMIAAYWGVCVDPEGTATGKEDGEQSRPFVADAIITSPASMLHVSLAQRLGVPLYTIESNPRDATREWSHSTINPTNTILVNCEENYKSWIKYEERVWKKYYKSLINEIRTETLGLRPLSGKFWPFQYETLNVPKSCLVSQSVLPRPKDFKEGREFVGYVYPDMPKGFKPAPGLLEFLEKPGTVIYIDFASNVHPDKQLLTSKVLGAVKTAGVRAIIRKSWFAEGASAPEGIFITDDLPHSWLFPRVALVVHAMGAGTTAMTLKSGVPSIPVPIRGDQFLWAKRTEQLGAAPGIMYMTDLDEERLATLIKQGLEPKYREAAQKVAKEMENDSDGAERVVELFHKYLEEKQALPAACSLLPGRNAIWKVSNRPGVVLSPLAAQILVEEKLCSYGDMELLKIVDWDRHACLKPNKKPRSRVADVVVKQRIEQGVYDLRELPVQTERTNGETMKSQVLSRWGEKTEQNGHA